MTAIIMDAKTVIQTIFERRIFDIQPKVISTLSTPHFLLPSAVFANNTDTILQIQIQRNANGTLISCENIRPGMSLFLMIITPILDNGCKYIFIVIITKPEKAYTNVIQIGRMYPF